MTAGSGSRSRRARCKSFSFRVDARQRRQGPGSLSTYSTSTLEKGQRGRVSGSERRFLLEEEEERMVFSRDGRRRLSTSRCPSRERERESPLTAFWKCTVAIASASSCPSQLKGRSEVHQRHRVPVITKTVKGHRPSGRIPAAASTLHSLALALSWSGGGGGAALPSQPRSRAIPHFVHQLSHPIPSRRHLRNHLQVLPARGLAAQLWRMQYNYSPPSPRKCREETKKRGRQTGRRTLIDFSDSIRHPPPFPALLSSRPRRRHPPNPPVRARLPNNRRLARQPFRSHDSVTRRSTF